MGNWGVNCEIARKDGVLVCWQSSLIGYQRRRATWRDWRGGLPTGKSTPFDALRSSFGNSSVLAAMKYSGQANVRYRPNRNLDVCLGRRM